MNDKKITRREAIKKTVNTSVAAGTLASMPQWILPALAQGEELVLFTDMPEDYSRPPARPGAPHWLDTRMISDFYTDNQRLLCCAALRPTRDRSLRLHP